MSVGHGEPLGETDEDSRDVERSHGDAAEIKPAASNAPLATPTTPPRMVMNLIERLAPMRPEMKLPAMKPTGKAKNHRPILAASAPRCSAARNEAAVACDR